MAREQLLRIVMPHAVCGIELDDTGEVIRAPPLLRYMHGWTFARLLAYCLQRGWVLELVPGTQDHSPPF